MSSLSMVRDALAVPLAVAATSWAVWRLSPVRAEGFRSGDDDDTIFVSIASFRDDDCRATLADMFAKAERPDRVFAGVCEQNSSAASEVCLPADFKWHDHVRRISLPAREAKGPTYARHLCSTLYRGETYFCQLDSHMRFVDNWDTLVVDMLAKCPSPKPVLTHYPHDYENSGTKDVPVLCKSTFKKDVLTFEAVTMPATKKPRPVPFTAGGFLFGPGSLVREVPFDPDLPHLFNGEELLYSARLWTSGYDFFTPTRNLVFHHYYRDDKPKFWNEVDYAAQQRDTLAKVDKLLSGRLPGYRHGMGAARSLDEYFAFAGIDWNAKTTASLAKFCV